MTPDSEFGTIKIHLQELITQKGVSKNKLSHRAELSWFQLERYCRNEITRLDIHVLAKICTVMDCTIEELLEYIPPNA